MMKLSDLKLLTDENISPRVVAFLRENGFDVHDVKESALNGTSDQILLDLALKEQRFVVTHDADFGTLTINKQLPCYGILYLRLLNQSALNVIEVLKLLIAMNPVISPSSLVVINETRIRVRML
jgi:predicted nuclease of predicted toxin-antitoxin system